MLVSLKIFCSIIAKLNLLTTLYNCYGNCCYDNCFGKVGYFTSLCFTSYIYGTILNLAGKVYKTVYYTCGVYQGACAPGWLYCKLIAYQDGVLYICFIPG